MAQALGTVFAAVTFAGASYLFKHLDGDDYASEAKRHNLAMEKFTAAKEKFYEQQVLRNNKIEELRKKIQEADSDIHSTNESLDLVAKLQQIQSKEKLGEPKEEDFYKPSKKMQEYELIASGLIALPVGYLGYLFL